MILYEDELQRLEEVTGRLWRDASATAVFLIDVGGQLVSCIGAYQTIDTTAMASLVAGSVLATTSLANILGEEDFPTHFHEGKQEHLYIARIADGLILAVVFGGDTSLGLVRLRVKKAAAKLATVYQEIEIRSQSDTGGFDPFSDISEDDIDRFFGDSF